MAHLVRAPVHLRSRYATVEMGTKCQGLLGAAPAPLVAQLTCVRRHNRQACFHSLDVTEGAPSPPRPFPVRVSPRQADPDASPGRCLSSCTSRTTAQRASKSCSAPRGRRSARQPPTGSSFNQSLQNQCGRCSRTTGAPVQGPRL